MGWVARVKRFRGGLVFQAHRRVYHSNLGSRVKEEERRRRWRMARGGWASGCEAQLDQVVRYKERVLY